MRRRLVNELDGLFTVWIGAIMLAAIPILFHELGRVENGSWFYFYAGATLLAVASFGGEFDRQTMGLLLSQPMPRHRIWLEKMAVARSPGTMCPGQRTVLEPGGEEHHRGGDSLVDRPDGPVRRPAVGCLDFHV
jgi:hypothetical protein